MKGAFKHIIILIGLFTLGVNELRAQQIPVYSQFFMNKYTQNPAFAGMDHVYDVTSNHRYQWVIFKTIQGLILSVLMGQQRI